jgi:hypothetical protein
MLLMPLHHRGQSGQPILPAQQMQGPVVEDQLLEVASCQCRSLHEALVKVLHHLKLEVREESIGHQELCVVKHFLKPVLAGHLGVESVPQQVVDQLLGLNNAGTSPHACYLVLHDLEGGQENALVGIALTLQLSRQFFAALLISFMPRNAFSLFRMAGLVRCTVIRIKFLVVVQTNCQQLWPHS